MRSAQRKTRRHYSLNHKLAIVIDSYHATGTLKEFAQQRGIPVGTLYKWRGETTQQVLMQETTLPTAPMVPKAQLEEANTRIRDLERVLGQKVMEIERLNRHGRRR